jgi:hypothetical protein
MKVDKKCRTGNSLRFALLTCSRCQMSTETVHWFSVQLQAASPLDGAPTEPAPNLGQMEQQAPPPPAAAVSQVGASILPIGQKSRALLVQCKANLILTSSKHVLLPLVLVQDAS